jgi:hypothetical protein
MRDFIASNQHGLYLIGWHVALLLTFLSGHSLGRYRRPRPRGRKH